MAIVPYRSSQAGNAVLALLVVYRVTLPGYPFQIDEEVFVMGNRVFGEALEGVITKYLVQPVQRLKGELSLPRGSAVCGKAATQPGHDPYRLAGLVHEDV